MIPRIEQAFSDFMGGLLVILCMGNMVCGVLRVIPNPRLWPRFAAAHEDPWLMPKGQCVADF